LSGHLARLVPLLAMVAAGCGGSAADDSTAAAGPGGTPAMPVEVIELTEKPVEQVAEFVGTVRSRGSATIQPQAEGFITKILVRSGDRVGPGSRLFEIDASTLQAALASLQSVRAAREADALFARQQAERAKTLLQVGAMSQQEYEQAATQQKTAEAQLKAVDEQIRQQQTELGYYTVTAPAAGIIGDIPVRMGDRVTQSTELTTIDDNSGLELYISVPVHQAASLMQGLPVRILDDTGRTTATERVTFIAPSVDDTTQTVLVKTPLAARGGLFRTEQFVRTQILFDTKPGLLVPLVAATRINGQYFVFVAEAGAQGTVARLRPVQLGRVVGNEYVVQSGLSAGDRLVVSGIQKIGEGAPISPVPAGAERGGGPAAAGDEGGRARARDGASSEPGSGGR
jgi:RND family efflux transporter MFP subunit